MIENKKRFKEEKIRARMEGISPFTLALSVGEVFANAKMKLCRCLASSTVKLRSRSEVKFAHHFAAGETSLTSCYATPGTSLSKITSLAQRANLVVA